MSVNSFSNIITVYTPSFFQKKAASVETFKATSSHLGIDLVEVKAQDGASFFCDIFVSGENRLAKKAYLSDICKTNNFSVFNQHLSSFSEDGIINFGFDFKEGSLEQSTSLVRLNAASSLDFLDAAVALQENLLSEPRVNLPEHLTSFIQNVDKKQMSYMLTGASFDDLCMTYTNAKTYYHDVKNALDSFSVFDFSKRPHFAFKSKVSTLFSRMRRARS